VCLTGEVRRPGLYPLVAGLTLLSAIELAGGVTAFASVRQVRLFRTHAGTSHRLEADLGRIRRGKAPDIPLRGDDRIEVPRRWF